MARNHAILAIAAAVLLLAIGESAVNAPTSVPTTTTPTASAPAPTLDCTTYILNLSDCLTYVAQGSNQTKPDKPCCPELAGLIDSHPICLCSMLGQAATYGVDVNRALKLPSACGVSTPPLSLCSMVGVPVGAPTASEGPTSAQSTVPLAPSPAGSETTSIAQAPSPTESSKEKSRASSSTPSLIIMGQIIGLVLSDCIGLFLF